MTLRFRQIGGLAELFADHEFSEAWDVDMDALRSNPPED